jgi:hypothetical protein
MAAVIRNAVYRHYKGQLYHVIDVAKHTETEEELVIYRAMYGERLMWARPLGMFTGNVEINGGVQRRFTYQAIYHD